MNNVGETSVEYRVIASALITHGLPRDLSDSIIAAWDRDKEPNVVKYLERVSAAVWDGSCDIIESVNRRPRPGLGVDNQTSLFT